LGPGKGGGTLATYTDEESHSCGSVLNYECHNFFFALIMILAVHFVLKYNYRDFIYINTGNTYIMASKNSALYNINHSIASTYTQDSEYLENETITG
jgi:hypothetical protein